MKCGIAKFVAPVLMYASVCGMHVSAEEYVWVGTESSSWFAPGSYKLSDGGPAEKLPAKDDIVKLDKNSSATVNDDSVAFVGSLARIMPQSGSTLVIDISTNATMGCAIAGGNSSSTTYGTLLKRGVGTLSLTAVGAVEAGNVFIDCYTSDLIVEKGGVIFPQSVPQTAKNYQLGNCTVGEGCFMKLSGGFNTYMKSLNGCGTVISDSTSSRTLRVNGSGQSLFSGKIEGANLSFEVYNGKADLTGAESTFAKTFSVNNGEVGVVDFGSVGSGSSSIGKDSSFSIKEDGGTVRYLGTVSGVVDKYIEIYPGDANAAPFTFDAGSFGGLKFTGTWSMFNNNKIPARMKRIVLTGSNTVECVLENAISGATASETNYSFSVTKKGRGVWRMANNASRRFTGSVMVDEGTLRFDSIGETNEVCSLGLATDAYGELQGVKPEFPLPYAIRLGSDEAEGVFEYTGDGFSQTKTRKIGLAGNARILHNGGNGFIRLLGGISAVTPGDKILALDGDGMVDCEVADVDDGDGRVSVVKEGSGVWALTGRQSFSGSLHVKEGTLHLRNPDYYTWFRFVVKSNLGSAETRLYELGLFDGSSNRVPFTALNTFADSRGNLQYGEAALIRDGKLHSAGPFENLFDENSGTYARFQLKPVNENEQTWIYVTMRVPADVKVCSYDFSAYNNGNYTDAGLKDFELQGSLDGVVWTTIDEKSGYAAKKNAKWNSDETNVEEGGRHCGFEIDSSIPQADRNEEFASRISDVRVDGGATLSLQGDVRLSKLTVDISDAGQIVGGEVAETGSLTIIGTVNDSTALPLNVTGMKNVQNFERWSVSVNGSVQPTVKALIRNGVLHLKYQKGFVLHVR